MILRFFILIFLAVTFPEQGLARVDFWQRVQTLKTGQTFFQMGLERKQGLGVPAAPGVQTSSFSKKFTWKQIEESMSPSQAESIQLYQKQNRQTPQSVVAEFDYHVNAETLEMAPGWGYGYSRNWSFGFRVPVRWVNYSIQSKLNVNEAALKVVAKAQGISATAYRQQLVSIAKTTQKKAHQKASERNGEVLMGDIDFLNKLSLPNLGRMEFSLLNTIRFPAAPNHNPHDGLFVQDDSGQFDVGLAINWRLFSESRWRLFGSFGYVAQLADSQKISWQDDAFSNSEVLSSVDRDLGDIGFALFHSQFQFSERIQLLGSYRFEQKGADKFEIEEKDKVYVTEPQNKHMGYFGLSFLFGNVDYGVPYRNQSAAHIQVAKTFSGYGENEDPLAEISLEWFY